MALKKKSPQVTGRKIGGLPSNGWDWEDPTANVIALTEAANRRQDDLREAERRYNDLRDAHQREIANLRDAHAKELDAKESSRLDSIRQVDREEVAKTAASANLALATLAKQTTDLSTTLQAQGQATAQALEARRQSDEARRQAEMAEASKRVSALELALSASAGKQTVADPALAMLAAEVKALRETSSIRTGFDAGKASLIAGAGVIGGGGIATLVALLMRG